MSEHPDPLQHEALLDSIHTAAEIEPQRVRQSMEATLAQIEVDTAAAILRIEADARGRATHTVDYESERILSSVQARRTTSVPQDQAKTPACVN